MSFFTDTVAVPVWLLILLIGGIIPLGVKLFKIFSHNKRGKITREEYSREERDNMVRWKLTTLRKSVLPTKTAADVEKDKSREKKVDMVHVLKIMAAEGDKGILAKTAADRLNISTSKVQQAMLQLTEKKLVEEVVGVSGTKYYLTAFGRNYCMKKGIAKVKS